MKKITILITFCLLIKVIKSQDALPDPNSDAKTIINGGNNIKFSPTVTAVCRSNNEMVITINTLNPFYGILTTRQSNNTKYCQMSGHGSRLTTLKLNMQASLNDEDYCGVSVNHKTSEKTVQISVRQHKTLELAEDKNYIVQCGKFNSAPPTSHLPARLYLTTLQDIEIKDAIKGHSYKLKIKTEKKFLVRNCFAFNSVHDSNNVILFDNGCPETRIVSDFTFSNQNNEAETEIYAMFRFQDSKLINFQCLITFCETCPPQNPCTKSSTDNPSFYSNTPQRLISNNETDVMISTIVNVLDAGELSDPYVYNIEDSCPPGSKFCPTWLVWLAVILGVLFILMLLVNLFLCTALTCTCTRTELIEKDPSIIEDYDPYRNNSWAGSQYGNSRYSIGEPQLQKKYTESNLSDHYAMPGGVNGGSRPGSRFERI